MRLKMAVLVGKWSIFEGDCWPMFNCWYIFLFKYNVQFSNLKFTICGVSIFEMSQFSMLPNSMLPANRSKILHFGKWNFIAEIERNIFFKKGFFATQLQWQFFYEDVSRKFNSGSFSLYSFMSNFISRECFRRKEIIMCVKFLGHFNLRLCPPPPKKKKKFRAEIISNWSSW